MAEIYTKQISVQNFLRKKINLVNYIDINLKIINKIYLFNAIEFYRTLSTNLVKGTRKRKVENESCDNKTTAKKSKSEMPASLDVVLFPKQKTNKNTKDVEIIHKIKKEIINSIEGIITGSIKPESPNYSSRF